MSPIQVKATSVAFAVFAQEPLDERRIVAHPLFVAVIAIDEDDQVGGMEIYFCALVVACWSAHAAHFVTIDRQPVDVDDAASDSLVRFTLCPV